MMLKELSLWAEKLKEGVQLAHSFHEDYGPGLPKQIKKIAFVGMGGSGVAGRIIKTFLDRKPGITTLIVDSPIVPACIDAETLAIVVTYSGQTWETLDVLEELTQKFIPTIVIASGGAAIQKAELKDLPFVLLPKSAAPRAALGHFLGFLAGLFQLMGILNGTNKVTQWIKQAEAYVPAFVEPSFFKDFISLANGCEFFHVWGVGGDSAACAYRATTQFNENSKLQAVYNEFPELCHNLIVGFENAQNNPFVVFFCSDFLPAHLTVAIQATTEVLREKGVVLYKPPVFGDTFESQLFTMVLWADFASYHLGKARGVDIEHVKLVEDLKKRHKTKGIK
ncbi:MAG: SIS domain-containing protein [Candidatus Babeliales bacterium]|jgi:glucose/mannose-6-phosphate isomerase